MEVIDSDGHVVERLTDLKPYGWSGEGCASDPGRVFAYAAQVAEGDQPHLSGIIDRLGFGAPGAFDPDARLSDMDADGITIAINYPTALLAVNTFDNPEDSFAACQAYNSWFSATYHKYAPDRMYGAALVPAGDIPSAVREAERAVTELGAVTVMLPPFYRDLHLCDEWFDPLWTKLMELGVPAAIHGTRMDTLPHLSRATFRDDGRFYAAAFPITMMIAMADVTLGGVLERFPDLRVVFLESSIGWMPSYIRRLDEAYEHGGGSGASRASYNYLTKRPGDYLASGNCFFSCEPDEAMFAATVGALGRGQVVFASDYPHFDCSFPNTVQRVIDASGLTLAEIEAIMSDNSRRLYRIT
jgi:predicted TIM-barrel fold metal-dependent hydrolase